MNKITTVFAIFALAAVLALVTPTDVAVAQTNNNVTPDGDGEYKEGERKEGKSCPNKEGKMNSIKQMI